MTDSNKYLFIDGIQCRQIGTTDALLKEDKIYGLKRAGNNQIADLVEIESNGAIEGDYVTISDFDIFKQENTGALDDLTAKLDGKEDAGACLPLTGGTVDGIVTFNQKVVLHNSFIEIDDSTTYSDWGYNWEAGVGAGFSIRSANYVGQDKYKGAFLLWARKNTTAQYVLEGRCDGVLAWNGSNVLTVANVWSEQFNALATTSKTIPGAIAELDTELATKADVNAGMIGTATKVTTLATNAELATAVQKINEIIARLEDRGVTKA